MKKIFVFLLLLGLLCSCTSKTLTSSSNQINKTFFINNYEIYVDESVEIKPIFIASEEELVYNYIGNNIRIKDNKICGLKSDTITSVEAKAINGGSQIFEVKVIAQNYLSKTNAELSENWFNNINIEPINNLNEEFPLGMDISMVQNIIEQKGKYFNSDGKAQNVYQILKDHGLNYVRLRLWHDPYNYYDDQKIPYGGGICDLDYVIKMASDAKEAGLKLLLNLHYSDFWADPSKQVIPKAWKDFTSVSQFEEAIEKYTEEVIIKLSNANAKPDMVQIGNETTSGMLLQYPGDTNTTLTGGEPYYSSQRTSLTASLKGTGSNFIKYLQAGIKGVKKVDSSIMTMIHLAKGMGDPNFIKNYFHQFDSIDYDIIGLSYYSYYHGNINLMSTTLKTISEEFSDKKITITETAYGFTYSPHSQASNIFSNSSTTYTFPLSGYDVNPQGQAKFIRDVINIVNGLPNGYGVFYWEGCWIPVKGAGWGDAGSKCSWANQALFTYDGKALPSLNVFNLIKGNY